MDDIVAQVWLRTAEFASACHHAFRLLPEGARNLAGKPNELACDLDETIPLEGADGFSVQRAQWKRGCGNLAERRRAALAERAFE